MMDEIDKLQARLTRCCTSINKILKDAKKIYPEATLYLDGTENLHLINGNSHSDLKGTGNQEKIIASARLHSAGGDW
jgi:polysaccharide pyruvyl transferase WcaK-like protein